MISSSEDSDSLATTAGLRCGATQERQPAHADQQQRARHLHPQPRARHALVSKYRDASGGASCKHGDVKSTECQDPPKDSTASFSHSPSLISATNQVRAGGLIAFRAGWGQSGVGQGRAGQG